MDSSVSSKDEIWFLRMCHHISNAVYVHVNWKQLPCNIILMWSLSWCHDSWIPASDIIIHFIDIGSIYLFKQSVSVHKHWFARPCAWWNYHLWKCCLHVLGRTMQQEYITVSTAMSYVARRKSHTGCSFFQLLHVFSQSYIKWISLVPTLMWGQCTFQYLHQLLLKYLFYHLL
jgi:hypothetical protein